MTIDGGHTWHPTSLRGPIVSVAGIGQAVMAVEGGCQPGGNVTAAAQTCPAAVVGFSENGGVSWDQGPLPSLSVSSDSLVQQPNLAALASASDGYVLEAGGLGLLATTNGGATWQDRTVPCRGATIDLSATLDGDGTLWVVCGSVPGTGSQAKQVYVSTTGGTSWSLRASTGLTGASTGGKLGGFGYDGMLTALSATTGYMTEGRLGLLVSTDGGRTWDDTPLTTPDGACSNGPVDFVGATHGWILCAPYGGLWTTQNGSTWTPLDGSSLG